ncbi:cation:proton antiporter [Natronocalculus amylovorans]|uniref:Cation:proton antiporter n=1 Tax=Natronocalculus amylovorans TaxID=2917812 RepID=A0AAE3K7S8_9EURY|nr:cation:proton antiporter [Natronocalculus amylovorans]MCL9816537.1 cation:proton antiporter [Natronocalculus amylovorans]
MSELIAPLAFVFIGSAILLLLVSRIGLPAVPLYIVVGLAIGEFIPPGLTLELAQLGIAFLVFVFGVNVEPERFFSVARDSEYVAAAQLFIVGGATFAVGFLLGLEPVSAAFFATAASLSSSLVGRKLAKTDIRENLIHGRLTESIHFVQDLFAIGIILVLSSAVFIPEAATTGTVLDGVALPLGYGVMILGVALAIRVYLFDFLVSLSGDSDELIMLTSIALLISFLALSEFVGVSIAVGAFAAGLAITRDFDANLSLQSALESIETFFTAIFFVTLGSLVAIPNVDVVALAIALGVSIVILKPVVTIVVLIREGYDARTACLTSFSLDQVSEFSLILAISGLLAGQITQQLFEVIILASAVTMITSTITYQYDDRIYRAFARTGVFDRVNTPNIEHGIETAKPLEDHVIVIGYGKLGSGVTAVCRDNETTVVIVESDPDRYELARDFHDTCVFGDAMSEQTWERLNPSAAKAIISTSSQRGLSSYLLSKETDADLILRADRIPEAIELHNQGAAYVTVPDFLASEQFGETISRLLEADAEPTALREENRRLLREQVSDARIVGQFPVDYLEYHR